MARASSRSDPVDVFESLVDVVVASGWVYALILAIAALDAVFPLVPSEATVVAAGALAGAGELMLGVVLLAGAAGAVLGDNIAYLLGRAGQRPLAARLLDSPKCRERIGRAETKLTERAGTIIVVSRFVPGGRTATMLSAGLIGLSWRRFIVYDVAAGTAWAVYAGVIGVVGGKAFSDEPLHALLLAFGLAAALMVAIEGARRLVRTTRDR
jgi:membrane protein DedA with SNARE-associated domain